MAHDTKDRRFDLAQDLDDPESLRSRRGVPGKSSATSRLGLTARDIERAFASALHGPVQRKASGAAMAEGATASLVRAGSSTGAPLPVSVRGQFETALGICLGNVRVHTGEASQQAARQIGARAYTVGQDIHMAAGQYAPETSAGQHLLAHEVVHTAQQRTATPTAQAKLEVSNPGDALELEADRVADRMVAGTAASTVSPVSVSSVQRQVIHRTPEDQQSVGPAGAPQSAADNMQRNVELERRHAAQVRREADALIARAQQYAAQVNRASLQALERIRSWRSSVVDQGFARLEQDYSAVLTHVGAEVASELVEHALESTPVLGGMYKLIKAAVETAMLVEEIAGNRAAVSAEQAARGAGAQSEDNILTEIFGLRDSAMSTMHRAHQRVLTATDEIAGAQAGSAGQHADRETRQLAESESTTVTPDQAQDYDDSAAGVVRQGQAADAALAALRGAVGTLRDAPARIAASALEQLVRAQGLFVANREHGQMELQGSLRGPNARLQVSPMADAAAQGHRQGRLTGDASVPVMQQLGMGATFHLTVAHHNSELPQTAVIELRNGAVHWRAPHSEQRDLLLGEAVQVAGSYQRQDGTRRMRLENGARVRVALEQALRTQTLDALANLVLGVNNPYSG